MRRRLKRTTKQYIVVSLISVIIIGGAFTAVFIAAVGHVERKYRKEIQFLSEQLKTDKVYVYEAKADIPAGSRIKKEDLHYFQTYSNQAQDYYMTDENIGMVALIDISKGTQILKGMLTPNKVDSHLRELECNSFLINSNMKENDYSDIRIRFPNGEDYIVLSKKSIKNLSEEKDNCFLWLTEEEILNLSGAIVDAYLYTGTKLYTAKYIEPNLQKASVVTYRPSLASLILMEQDENIVEYASGELNKQLRRELEERLGQEPPGKAAEGISAAEGNVPAEDYFMNEETQEDTKPLYRERPQDKEGQVEYGG